MKKIYILLCLLAFADLNAQSPDLKTGISYNYGWNPGPNEIFLTWDFFNVGGSTANTFTIAYIASLDLNIDASDYLIEGVAYGGAVANAFATIDYSVALAPDALPSGNYNFIVFIDYGNNVAESNETNNIVKFGSFNFTNQAAGIHKNKTERALISIYPNPTTEKLFLTSNGVGINNSLTYTICNIQGKELLNGSMDAESLNNKTEIDLKQISSGIYFLNINTGGVVETHKLIVN